MPKPIDLGLVEQCKTLDAMGKNQTEIGKILGITRFRVSRYIAMEDPPEIAGELHVMRQEQVKKFGEKVWPLVQALVVSLDEDLRSGQMKARDKIIGIGVLIDKLNAIEAMGKGGNRGGNTTVRIEFYDESKGGVIVNPAEVPSGELEIPGDDMRLGSGENIFRLPGGDRDCLSIPEELGSDRSVDLPEPGGLRAPDDSGGTLGESGDAGGLGREFHDEQTVDGGDL